MVARLRGAVFCEDWKNKNRQIPATYRDEKMCWEAMRDVAHWLGFPVPNDPEDSLYIDYQEVLMLEREHIFDRAT